VTETINTFLYGVLTALAFVAALLFARYWRTSKDRFFAYVVVTFLCLAANWGSLAGRVSEEHAPYFYLPRLAAFVILLVGIIDKNRSSRSGD
jgi:hypothetical protein